MIPKWNKYMHAIFVFVVLRVDSSPGSQTNFVYCEKEFVFIFCVLCGDRR